MTTNRRSSGEGSIYQTPDGSWHVSLVVGTRPDGAPDRRHRRGQTRKAVLVKLRELEATRDSGTLAAAGRSATVGEWLDHYLEHVAPLKLRPRSLDDYSSKVRLYLKPVVGHVRLDKLTPEHVETVYAGMRTRGLSAGTVLKTHAILSSAMSVARKRGKVGRNVAELVGRPRYVRPDVTPLTGDEAALVLKAAQGSRNGARWDVALSLGLRQGESLGLRWRDVDLDAGTLAVRSALQRRTWQHGCDGSLRARTSRLLPPAALRWTRPHRTEVESRTTRPAAAGLPRGIAQGAPEGPDRGAAARRVALAVRRRMVRPRVHARNRGAGRRDHRLPRMAAATRARRARTVSAA